MSGKRMDWQFDEPFEICPICGNPDIEFAFNSHNSMIGFSGFSIYGCRICGAYFCNPQPTKESLEIFYIKEMEEIAEEHILEQSIERYSNLERRRKYRSQYFIPFQRHCSGGRVLDCGCGTGVFVKVLQDAGYSAFGIDISEKAIEMGTSELGVANLQHASIDDFKSDKPFDAIVALTIIEHLKEPIRFLYKANSLLEPDGIIFSHLPTCDSLQFKKLRDYWYWIMAPYHLFHFSIRSMEILLNQTGFEIMQSYPFYPSWYWAEAIANSQGLLAKYNMWRKDPDFVKYTIKIDEILDEISLEWGGTSSIQLVAQKRSGLEVPLGD
jgi:2-polyprenyl-3-methyl-5-hydroxy-6-metoxy-1,4-benzoquinol methylase